MDNRIPATRRPGTAQETRLRGDTLPAQGEMAERAPRLPHDHDESADSQSTPDPSTQGAGPQDADDPIRKSSPR